MKFIYIFIFYFFSYNFLFSSDYNDIFIVRSVVSTRDIGFLPGDEQEKVSLYEAQPWLWTQSLGRFP